MTQFKPELAAKVLAGEKTQTRRPAKPGDEFGLFLETREFAWIKRNGRLYAHVHHSYAVQPGRGKHQIGRYELIGIRRERVEDISDTDVIAEGLASRQEFLDIWHGFYGDAYPECWVLEMRVCT